MNKKYVDHLVIDLEEAKESLPAVSPFCNVKQMDDGEIWLGSIASEGNVRKISEWTGIDKKEFPPYGQLTPSQMRRLVGAIEALWTAYNWSHDLDIDLPVHISYQLLTLFWDEPVQYLPDAGFDITFCRGNRSACWLKEWCMCKDSPYDDLSGIKPDCSNHREEGEDHRHV